MARTAASSRRATSAGARPDVPLDAPQDVQADADAEPGGSGVKSARRAVELLEAFGADHAWLSLSELHTRTGIPRSSLHGLLRTLRDVGWIEADEAGTRFRLGVKALICGTAYLDRD